MVPRPDISDTVEAKAFLLLVRELNVIYKELEDSQLRVEMMALVSGAAGITLGVFIGWILWGI